MISEIAKQRVKEKNDIRKEEIERRSFIIEEKICTICGKDLKVKIESKRKGFIFSYKKITETYTCEKHGVVLIWDYLT